jgi:hypothetical protein
MNSYAGAVRLLRLIENFINSKEMSTEVDVLNPDWILVCFVIFICVAIIIAGIYFKSPAAIILGIAPIAMIIAHNTIPEMKEAFKGNYTKYVKDTKYTECNMENPDEKCREYIETEFINPSRRIAEDVGSNPSSINTLDSAKSFLETYKKQYENEFLAELEKWKTLNREGVAVTMDVLSKNPVPVSLTDKDIQVITARAAMNTKIWENFRHYSGTGSRHAFEWQYINSNSFAQQDLDDNYEFQNELFPASLDTQEFRDNQLNKITTEMDRRFGNGKEVK